MKNNSNPLVSIIIPTYNSEKTLEQCLMSIFTQTYRNMEIVIVDKESTDKTIQIARNFNTKVIVIPAKERSEQLNYGIRVSKGTYILRLDSDIVIESNLIEEAVKKCELDDYDAVAIFWEPDPTISFWSKVRILEKSFYRDDLLFISPSFFKRIILKKVKGFNEELVAGEDYDFLNRVLKYGFKIGFVKSKGIHIGEPRSLREIVTKNYYYGKTTWGFLRNNPKIGLLQISPIKLRFIKNGKKFIKDPALALGFVIYQILRYTSAMIGLLVYLTTSRD
jgi:glycosyltransferase involved in cell wall biosynthesis